MRPSLIRLLLIAGICSSAYADVTALWSQLSEKRKSLASYQQDLEDTTGFSLPGHNQSMKRTRSLYGSRGRWQERILSGSGELLFLFDGNALLRFEGNEYVREKLPRDGSTPEPQLYDQTSADLKKGNLVKRMPCGLSGSDHECLVLDVPVKAKLAGPSGGTKVTEGMRRIIADSVTGLVLLSQTSENRESRNSSYRADIVIRSARLSWNGPIDEGRLHIPSGCTEVKEFPKWDAQHMKKELTGKPAPELALHDINGKPLKLSELRGRTVLLDFWTTWCGPCRADAPSLDKLFKTYGGTKLSIIGVSVDEERATVQKFLSAHPHPYTIALTSENDMPRPYQVGAFPTYIIIDPDGNFSDAAQGDSGFNKLKKLLKHAGMDTD